MIRFLCTDMLSYRLYFFSHPERIEVSRWNWISWPQWHLHTCPICHQTESTKHFWKMLSVFLEKPTQTCSSPCACTAIYIPCECGGVFEWTDFACVLSFARERKFLGKGLHPSYYTMMIIRAIKWSTWWEIFYCHCSSASYFGEHTVTELKSQVIKHLIRQVISNDSHCFLLPPCMSVIFPSGFPSAYCWALIECTG